LVGKNGKDPAIDQTITNLSELRDCMPDLWDVNN
jgi:hypothetical protein